MRHPHSFPYLLLFGLCLVLLAARDGRAVDAEEPSAVEADVTILPIEELPQPMSREELLFTRDLLEEIRSTREKQIAEVDLLKHRLLGTKDPALALRLQKQIQERKIHGQLELLEIQVRHARKMGHEDLAKDADESVQELRKLLDTQAQQGGDR